MAPRWRSVDPLAGASRPGGCPRRPGGGGAGAGRGWGARLLALQDPEGTWAGGQSGDGGLYSPKWTSTTYTMLLLRDLGLPPTDPNAARACALLLDRGLQPDGGIAYGFWKQSETCVTGMVLSILSYFEVDDERLDRIADRLLEQQMPDGGWNCRRRRGATHSSVHTTISALEGLHYYGRHRGRKARALGSAADRGRELTSVSPTASASCAIAGERTAGGRSSDGGAGRRTSRWSVSEPRAAGTRCARSVC